MPGCTNSLRIKYSFKKMKRYVRVQKSKDRISKHAAGTSLGADDVEGSISHTCPATADQARTAQARTCGICSRHACPMRALIVACNRDSKVIDRVACHGVLCGDARMFEAFSFQDVTAGSSEISTHLHYRLVRHQLMVHAREDNVCAEFFVGITC